jgi:hypothetical protein
VRAALLAGLGTLALVSSGCITTTLRTFGGGRGAAGAPREGTVLVVGSLHVAPRVGPMETGPAAALVGPTAENFYASFTQDLRSPYRRDRWPPVELSESAWIPLDGLFVVEVPARRLYLRGLMAAKNSARIHVDVTLELDVRPGDEVVYVGQVHVLRVPPAKILVKDRREMKESLPADLLRRKWVTRLAEPVEDGSAGIIRVELPEEPNFLLVAQNAGAINL